MTLASEIERVANDEEIIGCAIGDFNGRTTGTNDSCAPASEYLHRLLPWMEARSLLDYEWGRGYGAPDCNAVYAWTASQVIFIHSYDGFISAISVPRHPTDVHVHLIGED